MIALAALTMEVNWTGSGFNVKSDGNPIKKDWYDKNDHDVYIGEEVIPPVTVDVYLRVIDDETGITVNGRKYGFPVRLVKEVK